MNLTIKPFTRWIGAEVTALARPDRPDPRGAHRLLPHLRRTGGQRDPERLLPARASGDLRAIQRTQERPAVGHVRRGLAVAHRSHLHHALFLGCGASCTAHPDGWRRHDVRQHRARLRDAVAGLPADAPRPVCGARERQLALVRKPQTAVSRHADLRRPQQVDMPRGGAPPPGYRAPIAAAQRGVYPCPARDDRGGERAHPALPDGACDTPRSSSTGIAGARAIC